MPDTEARTIESRRDAFADANRWFQELLEAHRIPDATKGDLLLVFEEIVVNVINHAYEGREDGSIRITVDISDEAVSLTVLDEAPPFDPLARPDPDIDAPGPRAIGGLGVHLVKSLCDEVHYKRTDESNILTIRKQLNRPES